MSGPGWLRRFERSSLRRQYLLSLGLIATVLMLVALVCSVTVVWASAYIRDSSERTADLQIANASVLQTMTEAETGIRGHILSSGMAASLARYNAAMLWLPSDEQKLRALADGDTTLVRAVEAQERAIDTWMGEYATPRADEVSPREQSFTTGDRLFRQVQAANEAVTLRIEEVTGQIEERSRTVLLLALGVVTLLPLLLVAGVIVVIRRAGSAVVRPLTRIAGVLERLRAGERDVRAQVQGPEEIRQIAQALNSLTDENCRASEVEAHVLSQLETIDRVRTDLVSTVSHELRTPLTSINGYLELLQDDLHDQLSAQQAQMMGAVQRNLDRLNELVTNLLALSRAEETELQVEPIDLREIAAEVAADVRLQAAARDVTVRALPAGSAAVVVGDRSQLIRAVQNLVTNAVKFSRPGGVVELRVAPDGCEAVLAVVDEGIGIPAADLGGLGSRFFRASNAMRAEIAGTGLGLRIVQTILDRHAGALAVESVEGKGSTFTIRLPKEAPMGASEPGLIRLG